MSDNSRSDSVLDRAFPHSGPEPAAAILPAIWLDHVGINNLSRLRQVIESGDTRLASQVTIDLVKVVTERVFNAASVLWIRDWPSYLELSTSAESTPAPQLIARIEGVDISAFAFVPLTTRNSMADSDVEEDIFERDWTLTLDQSVPIRINYVLDASGHVLESQREQMLSTFVHGDGFIGTYLGKDGGRITPSLWLANCQQKSSTTVVRPTDLAVSLDAHRNVTTGFVDATSNASDWDLGL
jgi:hypothetical protein